MRGRNGTWHRYYYCRNHDPLRAGGQDRRCPERNIRADALDEFVYAQILAAELSRLDRKIESARAEHNRLIDLYQTGLITMPELQRRAAAVTARQRELDTKRANLAADRAELARGNRLRQSVQDFAARIRAVIDQLDHNQRQQLLRLLIDEVQVTGWNVKIQLRIPLSAPPDSTPKPPRPPQPASCVNRRPFAFPSC